MSKKNLIQSKRKYPNFSSQIFDEYKSKGQARIISSDTYDRFISKLGQGVYEDFKEMKEKRIASLRKTT